MVGTMKPLHTHKLRRPIIRKHLNADALIRSLYKIFAKISDSRQGKVDISMADALMSGYAVFSLKDPSLHAFDQRRNIDENLHSIYRIKKTPSDTQMRTILDNVDPDELRKVFKIPFRALQRGKALEPMKFYKGRYLVSLDGTGYFSSKKLFSEKCLVKKNKKTGELTYHLQMLGAAIVHPNFKEVVPLAPEFIVKQDGQTKNDCERNAAKRFFMKLRKEHPHLPIIITEDSLSSNAPHIWEAEKHKE